MCARTAAAPRPTFGLTDPELLTVHQIHSTDVLTVADATLDLARRAQGGWAGHRPAGRRAGRDGRRLRAGAAGRCRRRRDRRGACRLEGRAERRRRRHDRRDGKLGARREQTCAPRSAPASAATPTRSGPNSPRRSSRRTKPTLPSFSQRRATLGKAKGKPVLRQFSDSDYETVPHRPVIQRRHG